LGEARTGRGWIKQKLDEKDRRVRRLMLSGKGRSVYARMIGDIRTFNRGLEA
jgi:DNA-binding MarR family transcriptional regulator